MKKFLTKIIGATLGFAMVIGAGVGAANKGMTRAYADDDEIVYKSVTFSSSTMEKGVGNYTTASWTNTTTGDTGISVSLAYFNNNNNWPTYQ